MSYSPEAASAVRVALARMSKALNENGQDISFTARAGEAYTFLVVERKEWILGFIRTKVPLILMIQENVLLIRSESSVMLGHFEKEFEVAKKEGVVSKVEIVEGRS